ncbi:MAG TPA: class I SAM-dependent methyltransferase [Acidimicrobiales bacterium]|nr:class I SAM-dependent methyltransferase [Acidimicrobiales bacterium]
MPVLTRSRQDPTRFAQQLFQGLPRRYDLLAEALSFGQNRRWRRAMVDSVVDGGPTTVLDVATGTAGVAVQLARRTGARVTGIDITEAMLRRGRAAVRQEGLQARIALVSGQAELLPFPVATFDALTFTYLLRYVADPAATLAELARVVRPGGAVASLEFHLPPQPLPRGAWWLYTRVGLPVLGGLAGREWYRVGRFLGPSISAHYDRYSDAWTVDAWQRAGISDIGIRLMSLGGGVVMWGRRTDG